MVLYAEMERIMTKKIVLYCLAVMCCVLTVGCSGKKEDGQGSGKDLKIMFTVSDLSLIHI